MISKVLNQVGCIMKIIYEYTSKRSLQKPEEQQWYANSWPFHQLQLKVLFGPEHQLSTESQCCL